MARTKQKRLTKAQREWCERYEADTGFEPMMGDFHEGSLSFYEAAQKQIRWYRDHADEAMHSIARNVPGYEEHLDARDAKANASPSPAPGATDHV